MPTSLNTELKTGDARLHSKRKSIRQISRFHIIFSRFFYAFGKLVATHKTHFILVPLLLTLLGGTGFQQLRYENDPEMLFSPTTGNAWKERKLIESYFSMNYTHTFNPTRNTRRNRAIKFIVTAKDSGSILRKVIYDELTKFDQLIRNISVKIGDDVIYYQDICAVSKDECKNIPVLNIADVIEEVENKTIELLYPINIEPFLLPHYLGGVETREDGQVLDFVKAVQLSYYLKGSNDEDKKRSSIWEKEVLKYVENKSFTFIDIVRFASNTIEEELEKNTNSVIQFVIPTLAIATIFILISGFMSDWVRAKPILGLIGVTISVFSTITAFGLLMYCGAPFIGINLAAPFLTLGIGLDDTFVMLSAWRRTNMQDPIPHRLAAAYSEAAVSITVTSLTDILSFFTGLMVPFPSIQIFCLYAGTAVLFTYLWHITLFGGCLAVAGILEEKQRHSIFCVKIKPKSESESMPFLYRMFCTGGINRSDPWNQKDNQDHVIMLFFRDYVANFINISKMKVLIIFLFMAYMGGAIYGCTQLKEGLEMKRLSREDSYSIDFYEASFKYFRVLPYSVQVVITGNVTYSDPETKAAYLNLVELFENQTYVNTTFTQSVIKSWYLFVEDTADFLEFDITDEESFIRNLKEAYLSDPYEVFNEDIVFNEDNTQIIASRLILQIYERWEPNDDKIAMEGLREIAENSEFNVTVFNPYFIFYDQFVIVKPVTIQAVSVAAIVMVLVSFLFIPNVWCSLCIGFSIVSIEIGVIGYMALWNVSLDSISMLVLIMCIGFSVDFSAHISHAYLTANVDTPNDRVRTCLFNVGLPIMQGGLSTVLSLVTFAFAPSYIFKTFLKIVFLVILFGIAHGLFLLPVLLSIFGPGSRNKRYSISDPNISTITLPRPSLLYRDSEIIHYEKKNDKPKTSLDKDLDIGTSSENSSENNSIEATRTLQTNGELRKTGTESANKSDVKSKLFYHNRGYTSDTEMEENSNGLRMSGNNLPYRDPGYHHRRYSNRDFNQKPPIRTKRSHKSHSESQASSENPYV